MLDRQALVPPGYAERSCVLVRYRLPGLRHCFVLCHEPAAGSMPGADLMAFFLTEAERLAHAAVGDAQAFMLIHSGSQAMRARALYTWEGGVAGRCVRRVGARAGRPRVGSQRVRDRKGPLVLYIDTVRL